MFDGTLRGQSDALLVFVNMLTNADRDGFVDRHFKAIAEETGLPSERVKRAIAMLESPDPESRSRDLEGRRLERVDMYRAWGWRIVNYNYYRLLGRAEERRTYLTEKQREHRQRLAAANQGAPKKPNQQPSTRVNSVNHVNTVNQSEQSQPIAEAEADAEVENTVPLYKSPRARSSNPLDGGFEEFWKTYPRKVGKAAAVRAWRKNGCVGRVEAIIAKVREMRLTKQWMRDGGQYIPHPATWLNRGGWDDQPEVENNPPPQSLF